jgi:hypothetical protein
VALALGLTTTALAYAGQVPGTVSISGPASTLSCGLPTSVSATVVDASSNPIAGQAVHWSFGSSPSTADTVSPTQTTTNADGVATSTVTLACVAGDRTVIATADAIIGAAVLGVTMGGLPRTSTESVPGPVGNLPILTMFAALAVLVGGGGIVRRLAFSPR